MKSMYMLTQRELSALPPVQAPERSQAYEDAEAEGRPMKSHYDTSLQIHRMTGGGPKDNSEESGPVATAVNPNRHVMMINGRPVMALGVNANSQRWPFRHAPALHAARRLCSCIELAAMHRCSPTPCPSPLRQSEVWNCR